MATEETINLVKEELKRNPNVSYQELRAKHGAHTGLVSRLKKELGFTMQHEGPIKGRGYKTVKAFAYLAEHPEASIDEVAQASGAARSNAAKLRQEYLRRERGAFRAGGAFQAKDSSASSYPQKAKKPRRMKDPSKLSPKEQAAHSIAYWKEIKTLRIRTKRMVSILDEWLATVENLPTPPLASLPTN